MSVANMKKSAREIAEAEFKEEKQKSDVARYKELLEKRHKAQKVLDAIDLEIQDLDAELNG